MQVEFIASEVTAVLRGLTLLYNATGNIADASRAATITAAAQLMNVSPLVAERILKGES